MEPTHHDALLQAVHAAYESRDADEARRLLQNGKEPVNCSIFLHCDDADYLQWLLSNNIITTSETETEHWPGLQEKQLQCNALPEIERPRCILSGEWEESGFSPRE